MRGTKKILAVFLALSLIVLLFASCKKEEEITVSNVTVAGEDGQVISVNQGSVFKLPYARSDSLNPFFAQSLNNQTLATLLYDGLFRLDDTFTAQPLLAQQCTQEGAQLTVTLKSGLKFSDGSPLTGEDVVYSFQKAKTAPAYAANLAGLTAASSSAAGQVIFTVAGNNKNAVQLLTFPVVKSGTGNAAEDLPVGVGRFIPNMESQTPHLAPNPFYTQATVLTQIDLVSAQSESEIENALRIGKISFIFNDLGSGSQTAGTFQTAMVPLNNLIYLGFNPNNFVGQSGFMRQAVSYGINRKEIVSGTYHSLATSATSVFNPLWPGAKGTEIAADITDPRGAETAIAQAGYKGAPLKLLVNSDNNYRRAAADMIAKQLNAKGISVSVTAVPYASYREYLTAGYYDLFLGEVRLTDDMNLNCFFTPEGSCAFSFNLAESKSAPAYAAYLSGKTSIGNFMMAFKEEMPIVPVAYRKGIVSYTNLMKVKPIGTYGDVFANIEQWTF